MRPSRRPICPAVCLGLGSPDTSNILPTRPDLATYGKFGHSYFRLSGTDGRAPTIFAPDDQSRSTPDNPGVVMVFIDGSHKRK